MPPQISVAAWVYDGGKYHAVREYRASTALDGNVTFLCTTLCGKEAEPYKLLVFLLRPEEVICDDCEHVYERHYMVSR